MKLRLENDFHGSLVDVEAEILEDGHGDRWIELTDNRAMRTKKQLCGIEGCTCSAASGARGIQLDPDRNVFRVEE